MVSSMNAINWDQLKPRILQDLENGKTQQQIREGLANDPDATCRVTISKSQLETKLKHWKYRRSLHEPEWKVVSHRIKKRRKAGKPTSQVLVNGFIFSEKQISKAINRYDTPTLLPRSPSPQIPTELSHHVIEVRTPPPSHRSLQLQPSKYTVATRVREIPDLPNLAGRDWPRNTQWKMVEQSVEQFAARFFIPAYEHEDRFHDMLFGTLWLRLPELRAFQDKIARAQHSENETFLPDQSSGPSPMLHENSQRHEMQRPSDRAHVHITVVETILALLYDFSNQFLEYPGYEKLSWIIDSPLWDTVLPHLKDALAVVDPKIVQIFAEGLLKESIRHSHQKMLDLSLALGADPTQRISYFDEYDGRLIRATPLVAICQQNCWGSPSIRFDGESLLLSVLPREPYVTDKSLMWIIKTGCHAIAENVIRSQPERAIDFAIPVSDLGFRFGDSLAQYHSVTPLVLVCSLFRSAQKLSLVRCLLERNAKADLKAMIAAATVCDEEVIALLHQHGAPVNGFVPKLGTPLSSACKSTFPGPRCYPGNLRALTLLLSLGASPDDPENIDLEFSPLHILAVGRDCPLVTAAFNLLLKYGANINRRVDQRTPLEHAICESKWNAAMRLLSAGCELTGGEIHCIGITDTHCYDRLELRQLICALLARAPEQAADLHRRTGDGLTVVQRAIVNEDEDMILAFFDSGVTPMPSDFLHVLGTHSKYHEETFCQLSSDTQMRLLLADGYSLPPIIDASTLRRVMGFACPEVVKNILDGCPYLYDSKGLCYLIARVTSADEMLYDSPYHEGGPPDSGLDMADFHSFVSRKTLFNMSEDWESIAVALAARAGHVDILRMIIEPYPGASRPNAMVPLFLLKQALWMGHGERNNYSYLGVWIKYCRMDCPEMRCSPLTAAAMVVPQTAAEEVVNLLLALNYQPDVWTVLIASCQGYLSVLQRLKRLECWPHILSHVDRPDWCPTSLQIAVYHSHIDTVRFLLDTETGIDGMDVCPSRPFCAVWQDSEFVTPKTILPRTTLQHAVEMKNMELVTILVNAGADINAPAAMDSGATAFQIASIQGSIPMVQYLINLGADPYAVGAAKHGRTALQGAAEHGRKDVIEFILDNADSNDYRRRKQIVEAIFYAEMNEHRVVAGILRESLIPPWSQEDEEKFELLEEDWESSSEHSAFEHCEDEILNWDRNNQNWPESLGAHESRHDSPVCGDPQIEVPAARQENDFSSYVMDWEDEIHSGDIAVSRDTEWYGADGVSALPVQENEVGEMLLDHFFTI